ncbi:MAG: hypothetical protein II007_15245 [Gammaproteobacteria bacterium]|nr:hypothetical protein [Gammaproteobacteria bacterium]
MKLVISYALLLITVMGGTGCQSRMACPSATEIAEQRRHCEALQQQISNAPADRLQSRGALEEQYAKECEDLLYYRESHSDPESCLPPGH